jgi:3-hydroxyisobutyrate dehydrogenase
VVDNQMEKVGWIGTGVMGSPMCAHLLAAGYPVKVFSRTEKRASSLVEQGAQWCASPAEASEGSDVVVTMVGYPSDVRQVVLGDEGVLTTARNGSTIVDMTTSEPLLAQEIFEAAAAKGISSLDAPVSGGDVGARNASLVIMVGGTEEAFDRVLPLFQRLGKAATLEGGAGAGHHTKMVNQIAIASGMVGVCEALLYAYRAGLDVAKVLDTIGPGAAGSWSLTNYGPRALRGDFEPGFKIDHFIKDLGIALSEARRMKLSLPGLALASQLYVAASAQGRGQKGTHALVLVLAQLSNVDWPTAGP